MKDELNFQLQRRRIWPTGTKVVLSTTLEPFIGVNTLNDLQRSQSALGLNLHGSLIDKIILLILLG